MTIDLDAPIFLLGMPRSGTTWLSQIFESAPDVIVRLSPPYAYDFRGKLTEKSDAEEWREVLLGAYQSTDRFVTQRWRRETGELVEFKKDPVHAAYIVVKDTRFHNLYRAGTKALPAAKTVYIVRHPAAALWSWRSCKEFPEDADFSREWRSGACRKIEGDGEYWGFDDWLALTTFYLDEQRRNPERTLVVRYEDFVTDALRSTERMFGFCGITITEECRSFVRSSQSTHDERPYSVFKSPKTRDAWRNAFPPDILVEIEQEAIAAGLECYLK